MPTPVIIPRIPPNIPNAPKTPPGTQPRSFPFPNGNPPGNKGPTDQDDCEEICVWAKIPTFTPKHIVYTYPNELPITIEGETWNTVVTTGDYNLQSGEYYRVFWTATNWFGQDLTSSFMGNNLHFNTWGNFTIARVPGWGASDGMGLFINYIQNGNLISDGLSVGNLGNAFEINREINRTTALMPGTFRIIRIVQLSNNQPVPPESNCRFRIFNSLGIPIIDITRNVCPTVTLIPESCIYPEGQKLIYKVQQPKYALQKIRLKVETQGNCILVKQYFDNVINNPFSELFAVTVVKECSPVGCPPPKYEIDCCKKSDCTDKQCPQGTTNRILIGGKILQCVSANGCVLAEIPYDPKCERVDCRC